MSEAPKRLAKDPAWAEDFLAVRAGQPEPVVLQRVEQRIALAVRSDAPGWLRWRWAILLGLLSAASATAAVTREAWWPAKRPTPETRAPARPPPVVSAPALEAPPAPQPEPEAAPTPLAPRTAPRRPRAPAPSGPAPAPAVEAAPPAPDPLADQLAQLQAAQDKLRRGDPRGAAEGAAALLRRYPDAAIAPEARGLRAEALVKSGQLVEATRAVEALTVDPGQGPKQAEWWRFLGDLWRQRGDCAQAGRAYRQALARPLPAASRRAAEAGLAACEARP